MDDVALLVNINDSSVLEELIHSVGHNLSESKADNEKLAVTFQRGEELV